MSAFFTSQETRYFLTSYLLENSEKIESLMGENPFKFFSFGRLYRTLTNLNLFSLAERYDFNEAYENYQDCYVKEERKDTPKKDIDDFTFMIKAKCFVYQCSEGCIDIHPYIEFISSLCGKIEEAYTKKNPRWRDSKEYIDLWN